MGYTHYWYLLTSAPEEKFVEKYQELVPLAKMILQLTDVEIIPQGRRGMTEVVGNDFIGLNGEGADGHETFFFSANCNGKLQMGDKIFNCCKTARKPYDTVVIAMLCAINHVYGPEMVEISSDGDMNGDEWAEGRQLFQEALAATTQGSA